MFYAAIVLTMNGLCLLTVKLNTVAISNSDSPEIIWGLGGPEEDHQLHHAAGLVV